MVGPSTSTTQETIKVMGRSKKYNDFLVSEPFVRGAKHGRNGATKAYVTIQCPHCNEIITEVAECIIKTQKAKECLNHLRGDPTAHPPIQPCQAARIAGVAVPERRESNNDAVREQTVVMQAQHAESMAVQTEQLHVQAETLELQRRSEAHLKAMREVQRLAVCEALGLSDHSSDDDDGAKISARTKRKLADMQAVATMDAFDRVARAGSFSPPRDEEPPIAVGKRVVDCVAAAAVDAGKVPGLQCQLASVNTEVGIAEGAPPAERVGAIRSLKWEAERAGQRVANKRHEAATHFQNISRAAGRTHVSLEDQVEHIQAISKATAVSKITSVAPNANNRQASKYSEHLRRLDAILGIRNAQPSGREDAVGRLKDTTKHTHFTSKIEKKLRIALSEDHLQDPADVESVSAARARLGL